MGGLYWRLDHGRAIHGTPVKARAAGNGLVETHLLVGLQGLPRMSAQRTALEGKEADILGLKRFKGDPVKLEMFLKNHVMWPHGCCSFPA